MSRWHDELRRELRESPMPSHGPEHFERIRERLRELQQEADAASEVSSRRPPVPPAPAARRRPVVRLAALAAAVAAVAAAVGLTWSGLPGLQRSEPAVATATTVLARVEDAMSGLGSISGDVVEYGTTRGRPYSHKVGSFVFTASGDYRIRQTDLGVEYTYDSLTRVAHRLTWEDGRVVYGERAAGLPDAGPFLAPWLGASQVLDRSVAAYARAVMAEAGPDAPVTPIDYEGRSAWRIDVAEPLVGGGDGGSVRIVVDAAAGYPLLVEHWSADGEVSGTRIEHVRLDQATDRSLFTVPADVDATLVPLTERYRQLSLAQAATLERKGPGHGQDHAARRGQTVASDFTPYIPRRIPDGFKLEGVTGAVNGAVLGRYTAPAHPGDVQSLTVVLTYRRGFDRFCVISRWRHANPPGSDDPFAEDMAPSPAACGVRIREGALRGVTAQVVIGLSEWPHLYAATGSRRLVSVSVAGDLTRQELIDVASSLQPITP